MVGIYVDFSPLLDKGQFLQFNTLWLDGANNEFNVFHQTGAGGAHGQINKTQTLPKGKALNGTEAKSINPFQKSHPLLKFCPFSHANLTLLLVQCVTSVTVRLRRMILGQIHADPFTIGIC